MQKIADFPKIRKNEVGKLVLIEIAPQHMTFIEKNYFHDKKVNSWLVLAIFGCFGWILGIYIRGQGEMTTKWFWARSMRNIWLLFRKIIFVIKYGCLRVFLDNFCKKLLIFLKFVPKNWKIGLNWNRFATYDYFYWEKILSWLKRKLMDSFREFFD